MISYASRGVMLTPGDVFGSGHRADLHTGRAPRSDGAGILPRLAARRRRRHAQSAGAGRDPANRPQNACTATDYRRGPTRTPRRRPSGSTGRRRKSPTPAGCTRSPTGCGRGCCPDGGYGWSNAGLVAGDGASLLVDTLFDLALTREMLAAMAPVTDRAPITDALITHSNGDHTHGNQLLDALGAGDRRQGHRRGNRPRHGSRDAGDDPDRRPGAGRDPISARPVRALRLQRHHAAQRRSDLRRPAHHRGRRPARSSC